MERASAAPSPPLASAGARRPPCGGSGIRADLKPGRYTLTFTRPDALTWDETVTLHPADTSRRRNRRRTGPTINTCCIIHYITGTAAARDIASLSQEADDQSAAVAAQMSYQLEANIDVTLMPRVIGQGGFTAGSVYVSYLDGNYMGNEMPILFHHEFVHFYDGEIGGDYRPSIFEEGLAVYLTGGHFKPEPLGPRAAALLDLGWYIPLTTWRTISTTSSTISVIWKPPRW